MVDPVFLQPAEFYEKMLIEPEEKGYILIYAVMEKAGKLVEKAMKFAKERNLAVVDISDDMTRKGEESDLTGIEKFPDC